MPENSYQPHNTQYYSHTFAFALPVFVLAGIWAESMSGFAVSAAGCLFVAALYADQLKCDFPNDPPWRWSVMAGMCYVVALIVLKFAATAIVNDYSWLMIFLALLFAMGVPAALGALIARLTARSC
jgi:hypothetical protein